MSLNSYESEQLLDLISHFNFYIKELEDDINTLIKLLKKNYTYYYHDTHDTTNNRNNFNNINYINNPLSSSLM
jgi:hypothetical protein